MDQSEAEVHIIFWLWQKVQDEPLVSIYLLQSYSHTRSYRGTYGFIFGGRECCVFWRYSSRGDNCSAYKWPKNNVQCNAIPKIKKTRWNNILGENCIELANFTTSILDLMVANWIYWWHVSRDSKRIFATIKSTIDAVKFSNTIQLSTF